MTTGNKSELIADCKEEIEAIRLRIMRTVSTSGSTAYLESCLKRQEIALEALTAQPHHNGMMMLSHKLSAAESKLAELEKPQHKTCDACINVLGSLGFNYKTAKLKDVLDEVKKLRSAPAINLAELVPDEIDFKNKPEFESEFSLGWNECRAAMLQNIEKNQ